MAKEQGIDLRLVTGSGALGRITKADLQDFIASGGDRRVAQMVHQDQDRLPQVGDAIFQCDTKTNEDGDEFLEGVQVRREKMSKIRRLTAERMIRSVRTSPHVTTTFAIDLHRMVQAKNNLAQSFISKHGIKLTYTPFFLEASVHALKEHPIVNASVDGDDILFKEDIQLGCAVAINTGLIVPVIKKAQNLDLSGLALELNSLVNKARNNQLSPADLQGGTFSITNPGMFGCLHSSPIINQPQVAIMSIGAIVEQPVVVEGQIVVRPICHVGLTFDHRIIDGEGGTKFLASLKNFLETYPPS
jgi:2-oxoglutarate dehydrogenase E2 component (dihydrolipoamide succinyltransferase)